MDILSIGNSFSQDAQRYLSRIAKADGVELSTYNLYIGGCPLNKHFRNMLSEERAYTLEMNGVSTKFRVSLKEALLNREWDIITLQQASHLSVDYETYQPYLNELVAYIRRYQPKAKIAIHQTWAYAQESKRLQEKMNYSSYKEMLSDLKDAYQKAAAEIGADVLIPSGEVFDAILESGVEQIHRDGFHASLGLGRYTLGLNWYRALLGKSVLENTFDDFDEEICEEEKKIAKTCVEKIAEKYNR